LTSELRETPFFNKGRLNTGEKFIDKTGRRSKKEEKKENEQEA
jgi:hypothetical protein